MYISVYYWPFGAGGAERTTQLHAELLARLGYSVLVVTPNYGALEYEVLNGVEVVRFPYPEKLSGVGEQVDHGLFKEEDFCRYMAGEIEKSCLGKDIGYLHAQNFHILMSSKMVSERLSVPLITHIRDTDGICSLAGVCLMEEGVSHPPSRCHLLKNIYCSVFRVSRIYGLDLSIGGKMDRLLNLSSLNTMRQNYDYYLRKIEVHEYAKKNVFNSEGLLDIYHRLKFFKRKEKLKVIYNLSYPRKNIDMGGRGSGGLNRVRDLKSAGNLIVLYVGKVSRGKGSDILFKAHRMVLDRLKNVYLVIAGNFYSEGWEYEKGRTVRLGFISRDDLEIVFEYCDLVVLPSTWPEPFSRSLLDAGLFCKAIVATLVGGTAEIVEDGVTGLLVKKLDFEGMALAMERLLTNSELRLRMGENARERIEEKFGEGRIGAQLRELYRD